jgi:hypothetical protein
VIGPAADCHTKICKSHTTFPDVLLQVDKAKGAPDLRLHWSCATIVSRCRSPFAFCLLPFALHLLPFAFYLSPFSFCLLPFAFSL